MAILCDAFAHIREQFWKLSQDLMEAHHSLIRKVRLISAIVRVKIDQQSLTHFRQSQCDFCKDLDGLPCHFDVHVIGIIIELVQQVAKIVFICKFSKDLHLDALDIGWFIGLAIKILKVLLEVLFSVHVEDHVFNVLQNYVHGFIGA